MKIWRVVIALWTGVEDNGSIHDRNGTWGMMLTMGIASAIVTGLCIFKCMYAICLYCPPWPKGFWTRRTIKVTYWPVSSTQVKLVFRTWLTRTPSHTRLTWRPPTLGRNLQPLEFLNLHHQKYLFLRKWGCVAILDADRFLITGGEKSSYQTSSFIWHRTTGWQTNVGVSY